MLLCCIWPLQVFNGVALMLTWALLSLSNLDAKVCVEINMHGLHAHAFQAGTQNPLEHLTDHVDSAQN